MKVAQAIEELKRLPPDAEIGLFRFRGGTSIKHIKFFPLQGFPYNPEDDARVGLAIHETKE